MSWTNPWPSADPSRFAAGTRRLSKKRSGVLALLAHVVHDAAPLEAWRVVGELGRQQRHARRAQLTRPPVEVPIRMPIALGLLAAAQPPW
jgi:hypothetical protein